MTMRGAELPVPGLVWGAYPERRDLARDISQRLRAWVDAAPAWLRSAQNLRYARFAARVLVQQGELAALPVVELQRRTLRLRARFSASGFEDALVHEGMALAAVACARELRLTPYSAQIHAARAILDGHLAEVATGEGKTIALALAAAVAALAGIPVHLITANEYLVTRDAQWLKPMYAALGLSVDVVTHDMKPDRRRRSYACDIAYCTAKELVFDYLRDLIARGPERDALLARAGRLGQDRRSRAATVLRGLCFAIIDEADGILIDEARVPLILAQAVNGNGERVYLQQALDLAASLARGRDYELDLENRSASLTEQGSALLDERAQTLPAWWRNRLQRAETIVQALAALYLFERDRHYVVRGDEVLIVDETTGRVAPGRKWTRSLHQLIELKETCPTSSDQRTAAQITYQRFFPRYLRLAGMSGTLAESRAELASLYGLRVVGVPLHRPLQRRSWPTRVFGSHAALWRATVVRVRELHTQGRPVLIGTDSVADSEALSAELAQAGLAHRVLNARQDEAEAEIVAAAGRRGAITVATNMAGRGTDIALGPGVKELGGLHVICCQFNAARRIDRQLRGRAGRRGEPGSVETLLSLQAPLLAAYVPRWLAAALAQREEIRPRAISSLLARLPQRLEQSRQRAQRAQLLQQDIDMERGLAFGGRGE